MPFALLNNNVGPVLQIEDTVYDVAVPLVWESCGAEVEVGWVFDTGVFHEPPWPEPSLVEAQETAKSRLALYYQAYSSSQFVAGSDVFSAQNPISFLVIAEVLRIDPTNTSQVIFDILGDPHPVADATAWGNFWDKYVDLFDTARGIVGQAWQEVKAATTYQEVKTIMDTLPPIPGS